MPVLGDPTILEELAGRYERHAGCVTTSGRRLRHAAHNASWECDAADRFRAEVQMTSAQSDSLADEMQAVAQGLRGLAAQLREEIAELTAIEARVRQVLAEMSAATNPPWAGTAWHPANLPPSCDSTWRSVGRAFGV